MKRTVYSLQIFLILSSILFPNLQAQEDPGRMPEDIRFIRRDTSRMTASELGEWKRKLNGVPDITTRLFDMLWLYVNGKFPNETFEILNALSFRTDLNRLQLARITDRMKSLHPKTATLFTHADTDWDNCDTNFIIGGVLVLQNHPSSAHEELVLDILNNSNLHLETIAVHTLGKIGTEKSVLAVSKFADLYRSHAPDELTMKVLTAERELLARTAAAKAAGDAATDAAAPGPTIPSVKHAASAAPDGQNDFPAWPIWTTVGILATAAAWFVRSFLNRAK